MQKPEQDLREYRSIELDNKLQVLLVSDIDADKAACCLDVHVGSMADRHSGIDGLAHFCEHLLFMGTMKYPAENEYSQFLSAHSGHSNAYTAGEHTNYYFDVSAEPGILEMAVDRFSQFFVAPLLLESCVVREMNAVDSEHKKNLQTDAWRNQQLEKDLCNPLHPFNHFATGNIETLRDMPLMKNQNIRSVLIDFHDKFYSSNIMKVVILGRESIQDLELIARKYFSHIQNKSLSLPEYGEVLPLTENELGIQILVKPVKSASVLTLTFPMPDYRSNYKTHPTNYIAHLIGHESQGSILSLLKTKGWAQSLSAGLGGLGGAGFDFFRISVELTAAGFKNYELIIVHIFEYIKMMQSEGAQEWKYRECSLIQAITFRFKEKTSPAAYCSELSGNMHDYLPEDVLSGSILMEKFDKVLIEECLNLFQVNQFRIMLQSSTFDTENWQTGKWYGTPYCVQKFSDTLKARLCNLSQNKSLFFPVPNSFIAENFLVAGNAEGTVVPHPLIAIDNEMMRLWYKKDELFLVPRANALFELRSPLAYQDVACCVLTRLFVESVKDELNEFAYYAELAGLEYSLQNSTEGMLLSVFGYNDKMPVLLSSIFSKMRTCEFTESKFQRTKEMTIKSYKNWFQNSPHSHAMYYVNLLTQERLYTTQEKLDIISDMQLEDLQEFSKALLSSMFVEGFIHGNISSQEACVIGKSVLDELKFTPLDMQDRVGDLGTFVIPLGSNLTYTKLVYNAENLNSAIEYCVQICPDFDAVARSKLSLLCQLLNEPVFDTLRTKEQLGYMVFSGIRIQQMLSFRIVIQSESNPGFLETRIELFLRQFSARLSTLSGDDYKKNQQSIYNKLTEKVKNLSQHTNQIWNCITGHRYEFDQRMTDATLILEITLAELVEFYQRFIDPESTQRRKISLHLVAKNVNSADYAGVVISDDTKREFQAKSRLLKGELVDCNKFLMTS